MLGSWGREINRSVSKSLLREKMFVKRGSKIVITSFKRPYNKRAKQLLFKN